MKRPPHLSIPPTPANSWLSENAVFLRKYKSCHRISGTLGTMVDHNTKHLISPDIHHGPIGFVQRLIKKIFSSIGDRCWRPWESIINQPEQYLMIQMDVSKLLPIQRNVMKFWTNEVLTSVGTELVVGTESEVDRRAARGVTRALCYPRCFLKTSLFKKIDWIFILTFPERTLSSDGPTLILDNCHKDWSERWSSPPAEFFKKETFKRNDKSIIHELFLMSWFSFAKLKFDFNNHNCHD